MINFNPTPTFSLIRQFAYPLIVTLMLSVRCLAQGNLADTIERCERSLVKIEVRSGEGGGQGSGFVVSSDGMIVTNVHVLAGGTTAVAIFPNGEKCQVEGTYVLDPQRDIAIAKIKSPNSLPVISISSTSARKGEQVSALGSPLGLSFTATTGIVSAIRSAEELKQELGVRELAGTWLQVDAAISPGNSGGPLINSKGEVVAMSTLASSGKAQNINFGISASDISNAIQAAKTKTLIPLSSGAAKVKSRGDEKGEDIGGDETGAKPQPVPESVIEEYLTETKDSMKELKRGMSSEKSKLTATIKEMKAGEVGFPGNVPENISVVRELRTKSTKYYFRSATVKNREVQRLEKHIRDFSKATERFNTGSEKEKILTLATSFGPPLDPQNKGKIGYMSGAHALHAFDSHVVAVDYNSAPYLLIMDSTAGLSEGMEINPTAVYVAGTTTAKLKGSSVSITILQAVSDDEIKQVALGGSENEDFRVWKTKDGKSKVEASLLSANDEEVTLKRRDTGKTIKVPISKLSDEDRKFIGK